VAAQSKARNVFYRSDSSVVDSNPTRGMDLWMYVCFFVCLCCPMKVAALREG
jgi:hypothetical protein